MFAFILAFPEKRWENYLLPVDEEPMVRIVERRLLEAKRIDDVFTIIKKGQLKRYSLHISNPVEVKAKNKLEALYKALPSSGEVFLVEGNMPLIMPFLVNYLSTLFLESDSEALIPSWRDGTLEVTHAFYEVKPLKRALETCLAENEKKLSCIAKHLDYEKVSIEALSSKNPKVTLSFFKVRNSFDLRFAEESLRKI
ncbi:molybdopterin-guanine dinucleotide biosynthesis protein A [Palaeococcus pacificus DY20341]|uniref:Molybdopterin-guanine dinucleotide biosynthesis protein A n=1 Tax=Palaeococcus pacificus DY20341 TaxID=1343739 RepID=A0A075LRA5_9EURY|nr:NTP transferase domain-containing protein [Palaeococcus pacificus]AIF68611.1 molybdopterin-guanine dinucleotide biosynthesis protein A [Palaeococcus pacificus DY20341]